MNCKTKTYASREEWLAARQSGIGASDTPIILGLSKWCSPFQLWARKRGLLPSEDESEAMYWGLKHERSIAEAYEEKTGRAVRRQSPFAISTSADHPEVACSFDAFTTANDTEVPLELKTCSLFKADDWDDGPPLMYQVQVQHQMYVAEAEMASVAVLVGGQKFLWCDVSRNDKFISAMVEKLREFWDRVQSGEAPDPDGDEATTRALTSIYSREFDGECIALDRDAVEWDCEISKLSEQIKALESRKNELQNRIRSAIGSAEYGMLPGGGRWSWKTQTRKEFTVPASESRVLRRLKG